MLSVISYIESTKVFKLIELCTGEIFYEDWNKLRSRLDFSFIYFVDGIFPSSTEVNYYGDMNLDITKVVNIYSDSVFYNGKYSRKIANVIIELRNGNIPKYDLSSISHYKSLAQRIIDNEFIILSFNSTNGMLKIVPTDENNILLSIDEAFNVNLKAIELLISSSSNSFKYISLDLYNKINSLNLSGLKLRSLSEVLSNSNLAKYKLLLNNEFTNDIVKVVFETDSYITSNLSVFIIFNISDSNKDLFEKIGINYNDFIQDFINNLTKLFTDLSLCIYDINNLFDYSYSFRVQLFRTTDFSNLSKGDFAYNYIKKFKLYDSFLMLCYKD